MWPGMAMPTEELCTIGSKLSHEFIRVLERRDQPTQTGTEARMPSPASGPRRRSGCDAVHCRPVADPPSAPDEPPRRSGHVPAGPDHCPRCGLHTRREALWLPIVCEGCGAKLRAGRGWAALMCTAVSLGVGLVCLGLALGYELVASVGGTLAAAGVLAFLLPVRLRVASNGTWCPACGYELTSLAAVTACPECGRTKPGPSGGR